MWQEIKAAQASPQLYQGENKVIQGLNTVPIVEDLFRNWYGKRILSQGLMMYPFRRAHLKAKLVGLGGAPREAEELAWCLDASNRVDRDLRQQIQDRLQDGNVFFDFQGPTGHGKSSAAMWLAYESGLFQGRIESLKELRSHVCYETWEVPRLLSRIGAGDVVLKDEARDDVGAGSRTTQKLLQRLEDEVRAERKSVFTCTPDRDVGVTNQGRFVAIARTRPDIVRGSGKGSTLFLVYEGNVPIGNVELPWCSPDLFGLYSVVKKENTENAQNARKSGGGRVVSYVEELVARAPHILTDMELKEKEVKELVSWMLMDHEIEVKLEGYVTRYIEHVRDALFDKRDEGIEAVAAELHDRWLMTVGPETLQVLEGACAA